MAEKILKRLLAITLGLAWGVVSFFWLGYKYINTRKLYGRTRFIRLRR